MHLYVLYVRIQQSILSIGHTLYLLVCVYYISMYPYTNMYIYVYVYIHICKYKIDTNDIDIYI